MDRLVINKENEYQTSVWFNMPTLSVMEKFINDIICITAEKENSSPVTEELNDPLWFDESHESPQAHLEDDDDETLLASIAL